MSSSWHHSRGVLLNLKTVCTDLDTEVLFEAATNGLEGGDLLAVHEVMGANLSAKKVLLGCQATEYLVFRVISLPDGGLVSLSTLYYGVMVFEHLHELVAVSVGQFGVQVVSLAHVL